MKHNNVKLLDLGKGCLQGSCKRWRELFVRPHLPIYQHLFQRRLLASLDIPDVITDKLVVKSFAPWISICQRYGGTITLVQTRVNIFLDLCEALSEYPWRRPVFSRQCFGNCTSRGREPPEADVAVLDLVDG